MPKDHTYRYDFSVIEKYLRSELSPAEMHELERAALSDPFLADALEGYQDADLDQGRQHLMDIRQLVAGEKESGKMVPLRKPGAPWLQMAAICILLAGVGTIVWKFNQPVPSPKLASATVSNKDSMQDVFTPSPQVSDKDTQRSLSEAAGKNTLIAQTAPPSVKEKEQPTTVLKDVYTHKLQEAATISENIQKKALTDSMMQDQLMRSSAATLSNRTVISQALSGKVAGVQVLPASPSYVLKGKVVGFMQKPLSYATVQFTTAGVQKAITTYSDGSFQINSKDSVMNATVSALGHQPVTLNLSAAANNFVALRQGSETLNEVVVVGYGRERKTSFTGSVSKENAVKDTTSIRPPGGIDAFILLIRQQWQRQQWDSSELKGNIECILSFNSNGYITKVSFTKKHSRLFKKRFTKLLKTGPSWEKTETLSATDHKVVLSF